MPGFQVFSNPQQKNQLSLWEPGLREAFWQSPYAFLSSKTPNIMKPADIPNHLTFLKVPHVWIFRTMDRAAFTVWDTGQLETTWPCPWLFLCFHGDDLVITLMIRCSADWDVQIFCLTVGFLCEQEIHDLILDFIPWVPAFIFMLSFHKEVSASHSCGEERETEACEIGQGWTAHGKEEGLTAPHSF